MKRSPEKTLHNAKKRVMSCRTDPTPEPSVDSRPLEFFKVFLPGDDTHGLSIPPDFIHQLKESLPSEALLTSRAGKTWSVNLEKEGDNVFFKSGWGEFLKDSGLEVGDFLVFTYNGRSKFSVKVFGHDGCVKEKATTLTHNETCRISDEEEEEIGIKPDITTLGSDKSSKGDETAHEDQNVAKSMETPRKDDDDRVEGRSEGKNYDSVKPKTGSSESEALREAKSYMFESKNPSFHVVMKPTYVTKRLINVRKAFIEKHLGCEKITKIELKMAGRVWKVLVCMNAASCKFGRGWHDFVLDNDLSVGDVCVFELVKENQSFLKLSIFRCLKE